MEYDAKEVTFLRTVSRSGNKAYISLPQEAVDVMSPGKGEIFEIVVRRISKG